MNKKLNLNPYDMLNWHLNQALSFGMITFYRKSFYIFKIFQKKAIS